ncbi:MAG: FAD-dependent oxidoreductase [Legionella sp.]|jgi:flavin-dependent dehydrogenase
MTLDALIVGGGAAGATTALLLAQAGWSVGLVEQKEFPRRKVCGEFISASSLPLLQKLGIADYYLAHAGPEVERVGLYAGDTILISKMPEGNASAKWGRAFGRESLDTLLLNRAKDLGAQIWQPEQLIDVVAKNGNFVGIIRGNQEIPARLVIIANGSWEKRIGEADNRLHKANDLLAFKAHFKGSSQPLDLMSLLAFPGGYGGLVNTNGKRVTLSCCIRRDSLQELRQEHPGLPAGEAVLAYIQSSCLGVKQVLASAERVGSWLAAGPIQPGIRSCYKDNKFYVGNLAGEAHPIVAEGISMAMQSAWLLTQNLMNNKERILEHKDFASVGANYTKQWRKHFAPRIHAAALFANVAMMRPWASTLVMPVLRQFPSILTLGAKLSGKIHQITQ